MHSGYEITYTRETPNQFSMLYYVFVHVRLFIKIINGKEVTSLRERATWGHYQGHREKTLEGLQRGEGRSQ